MKQFSALLILASCVLISCGKKEKHAASEPLIELIQEKTVRHEKVDKDEVEPEDGALLIISPDRLLAAWEDYAETRRSPSLRVEVLSLADIITNTEGRDLQEKIRLAVRKKISTSGVRWVMLGGDSSPQGALIPDRDTLHRNMWGEDKDTPTDIYYISEGSWDADGDGVFGEFVDDREAISYPDGSVGIGRVPVRTEADVKAYGEKVAAYLASKAGGNETGDLALTCAVPGAYAKVWKTGSELIPAVWNGDIHVLFNDYSTWDAESRGDYDLTPGNIIDRMNEGLVNKWHIHGHGLTHCWNLENNLDFTAREVGRLQNLENLPVITTVSCFTGNFDALEDPCISEAMLRSPTGGAIAVVAPAREGKPHFHNPDEDFTLMTHEGKLDGTTQTMAGFWTAGLGEGRSLGMALAHSKARLAKDAATSATYHQGICEINLLGDPSLPFR